uniref:Uncharacterized protein n=1 Tax=Compsopogon caeruleus TaxID=31354 RepID=A0A7S1THN7_9RHOD|mmetsp:Transcript_7026/g.14534  ORF Transcript_7026/g.14534 Transcript_7026/m.14534 type:complete len:264 (+) Transcript_7026:119-910(+)|eukprot:CAMPEP_0184682354 /NCGR_PEP_ID=MMETSP0312-20130426/6839_1 /TAXON_ID=31354 /ORGANISM="Compsopogon coeruleus, Strain SAG 36.94" /LENGTH=263 /DNA_ID=CAMNT_0027133953 /DNA_START=78 /DNA_END=869 /DNA_ORIENTATION=-
MEEEEEGKVSSKQGRRSVGFAEETLVTPMKGLGSEGTRRIRRVLTPGPQQFLNLTEASMLIDEEDEEDEDEGGCRRRMGAASGEYSPLAGDVMPAGGAMSSVERERGAMGKTVEFEASVTNNEFTPKSLSRKGTPGPKQWPSGSGLVAERPVTKDPEHSEIFEKFQAADDLLMARASSDSEHMGTGELERFSSNSSKVRIDPTAIVEPLTPKRLIRDPTPNPRTLEEMVTQHGNQLKIWGETPPPKDQDVAELSAELERQDIC